MADVKWSQFDAGVIAEPVGLDADGDNVRGDVAQFMVIVPAGSDLSADRIGTGPNYWLFDAGVDPGAMGENVVNGLPGDIFFVAAS